MTSEEAENKLARLSLTVDTIAMTQRLVDEGMVEADAWKWCSAYLGDELERMRELDRLMKEKMKLLELKICSLLQRPISNTP